MALADSCAFSAAAEQPCAFGWPVHLRNSNPRRLTEGTPLKLLIVNHLQHRRDLRVGLVEDVMEEIGGALLGRETFEQQQECRRQRRGKLPVHGGRRRGLDGLGQPWTNIVDPCAMGGALDVETTARANGREPGRRRLYLAPIRIAPLKKAVLDDILCVRARPKNAISQPEQTGPRHLEELEVSIIHL